MRAARPAVVLALVPFALLGLLACTRGGPPDDASVLVISPDSLRTDRLPPWNPEAPPAPNLERLAKDGTVYRNAWATSPWTAPSMVSIFTGLYPPSHGVAYRDDTTPPDLATLPRLLAAKGYRLGNFSFFSQISYFRNLGLGPTVEGLGHAGVAERFAQWLEGLGPDERFFAWVHLLETHLPYGATGYRATEVQVPGSSGLERAQLQGTVPVGSVTFEDGDREKLLALYDRDVGAMDAALGRILDALDATGRRDHTVVIFVADHGEELLDHGWVGHASTSIEAKLVSEILHVPMIVAGPGLQSQIRQALVQPVDLLPTLAQWLDLDLPGPVDGRLLPGTGHFFERPRQLAYFDSSPGGNLTPQDRRGERLQGVTDGRCLLSVHSYPDRVPEFGLSAVRDELNREAVAPEVCGEDVGRRLRAALDDWRSAQSAQRMAILAAHPGAAPPSSEEADVYAETLELREPRPDRPLTWSGTQGLIALEWTGDAKHYWIEYRLSAAIAVTGAFPMEQNRVVFGPVPQGFWNDVAGYSPIRIRVVDPEGRRRSPWVEFAVEPSAPSP